MADSPDIDPRTRPYYDEVNAITERYLRDGLDHALVLSVLATLAIKTVHQADPQYRQLYLDYFSEAVRGAGDLTIIEE